MRLRNTIRLTALAICGAGLACSSIDQPEERAVGGERLDVGGTVETLSWWASGGEREALDALIQVHEERVKDASVTNTVEGNGAKARERLVTRLRQGVPPDTFLANSGADLFDWIKTNGVNADDSRIESLDDMADALGWRDVFDAEVLEAVSYDEEVYAVPLNVHRINMLFFRKDLFEKYELAVPKTLDELDALCETIRTRADIQEGGPGGDVACLGLGNKYNWTLSLFVHENLLPAVAGAQGYVDYFSGRDTALTDVILEAQERALSMFCLEGPPGECTARGWFNSDAFDLTWDEGVRKLTDGRALMAVMGDWAKGYLESEAGGKLVAGEDFEMVPFPGTAETFVFTADTFSLPRSAEHRDAARSLLKTFGSKEGQLAFNLKKGSIPARTDVDTAGFDEQSQRTIADFKSSKKVPAVSGILSGIKREGLNETLTSSIAKGDLELVRRFLEANYPL